ncbi:unnamed protein product [Heligmosomoides polygyrus]|uniref:G_PROTEIN_RECEP_F1_2 domain-containing protein n=1 Tax=Heligmosomoides polygyrus TaxID=6339 RepID=A0A183GMM5_HELPZ|nr:unnamed protein product [Heligmosomoides polygyrus]
MAAFCQALDNDVHPRPTIVIVFVVAVVVVVVVLTRQPVQQIRRKTLTNALIAVAVTIVLRVIDSRL